MAYSDNLDAVVDQWLLCPPFSSDAGAPWFSDADAFIAQALTVSVSSADNSNSLSDILTPVPSSNADTPRGGAQSISVSGSGSGFGSDHETNSKMKRSVPPPPASGRIGKRKPRASKKSPTTFITADAANFRQMVQDVTGVKLPRTTTLGRLSAVVKPEPQRFGAAVAGNGLIHGCLPTLDTSAFLIDRHNRQQALVAQSGAAAASQPPVVEIGGASGGVGSGRTTGFDFDGFSCFPTLESWKVM